MAAVAAIMDTEQNGLSKSESPCRRNASHQVWLNLTYHLGADEVLRFLRWSS